MWDIFKSKGRYWNLFAIVSQKLTSNYSNRLRVTFYSFTIYFVTLAISLTTEIRIVERFYLSTALKPFIWPWPLFQFLDLFTQSVGPLGRRISPSQGRYLHTGQYKYRINAHRHPCLKWDSTPRSQRSNERRQFMPKTARILWPACGTISEW
jgi:hypothetical protein